MCENKAPCPSKINGNGRFNQASGILLLTY